MNLHELEPGLQVFVEMNAHAKLEGRIYTGTVHSQWPRDRAVRVITEAAKEVHVKWQGMSFMWDTGKGMACRWARLIVPATEDEAAQWEARSRKSLCKFSDKLGLDAPILPEPKPSIPRAVTESPPPEPVKLPPWVRNNLPPPRPAIDEDEQMSRRYED